jgi:hypothetical protein
VVDSDTWTCRPNTAEVSVAVDPATTAGVATRLSGAAPELPLYLARIRTLRCSASVNVTFVSVIAKSVDADVRVRVAVPCVSP